MYSNWSNSRSPLIIVVISVCLFVCLIITHEPLDRFASNLETLECSYLDLKIPSSQTKLPFEINQIKSNQTFRDVLVPLNNFRNDFTNSQVKCGLMIRKDLHRII